MTEQDIQTWKQLKPAQKVLVALVVSVLLVPPTLAMAFDWPPALWLESQQAKIFGYYLPKATWALLTLSYALVLFALVCAITIPVRLLTGKTVVQLFSGKNSAVRQACLTNVLQPGSDIYADLHLRPEWVNNEETVSVECPGGCSIQVKLAAAMLEGSQLRLKGHAQSGGDLYLCVRISDQGSAA